MLVSAMRRVVIAAFMLVCVCVPSTALASARHDATRDFAQFDARCLERRRGSAQKLDAPVRQEQLAPGDGGSAGQRAELDAVAAIGREHHGEPAEGG